MGRPKKKEIDKKVKFGISIRRDLYNKLGKEKVSRSSFIQNLVEEYYERKSG